MIGELLQLLENRDIEVKDLATYFSPERVDKALKGDYKNGRRGLWGSPRLVYKGKRFFTDDEENGLDMGSVYMGAEEAAREWADDNDDVMMDTITTGYGDIEDVTFTLGQECYMGYDKKSDSLVIGFELEPDSRAVEEGIERLLDDEFGSEDDHDYGRDDDDDDDDDEDDRQDNTEQRNAAYHEIINDIGNGSMLFYLHSDDGENFEVVKTHMETRHSFYENGGCYDKARADGLIHLRLD
jgi:hypothetical protein